MRILYLINAPGGHLSGAARQTLSLATHQVARGHDVTIAAPADSAMFREAVERGFSTLAASFSPNPTVVMKLRRDVRALRPDLVHAMSFVPLAMAGYAHRSTSLPARFVSVLVDPVSPHALAMKNLRGTAVKVRTQLARDTSGAVDAVFCVSQSVASRLESIGATGNLVVVHDTIDVDDLEARARSLTLDLPQGRPRIGAAAVRLVPAKGVDVLVRAFARAADALPNAQLVIAGEPDPDLDLPGLARSLDIADRVTFLGFIEDTAALFSELDVFVLPSLSEGLNSSVLEAGALGVPVIAARVGGVPEAIADGETGLLVAPGDADALSKALVALLGDTGTSQRMGRNARARVLERFSAEKTFGVIDSHYDSAYESRSGKGRG